MVVAHILTTTINALENGLQQVIAKQSVIQKKKPRNTVINMYNSSNFTINGLRFKE